MMNSLTIYTESPGGCRKRKREYNSEKNEAENSIPDSKTKGILNQAFASSTPNKNFIRASLRRSARFNQAQSLSSNKENIQCELEVKSIAEIHLSKLNEKAEVSESEEVLENPFEVIRIPPKKKKKSEIEESCFENPALNLEAPEKNFNPFEIYRSPPKDLSSKNSCFVNNGLDIRVGDTNVNPYEVSRLKSPINTNEGIENPALEIRSPKSVPVPTNLTIGLPFKPTMGVRIDFQNVPLESLILNEPLGINKNLIGSKQLLPVIEEDDEIDIGKELDCYQLELENSINEAKLKKANIEIVRTKLKVIDEAYDNEEIEIIPNDTINDNISGIIPLADEKETSLNETQKCENDCKLKTEEVTDDTDKKEILSVTHITTPEIGIKKPNQEYEYDNNVSQISSCESDFEEPAPFVRCYRKPIINQPELIQEDKLAELSNKDQIKETKSRIGNAIRRSIRKLISHPNKKHDEIVCENKEIKENEQYKHNHNIFQSIRHSLRRKPLKTDQFNNETTRKNKQNEISIIDCTERTKIFRSPNKIQTKDIKVEKIKNMFSKNKYNF